MKKIIIFIIVLLLSITGATAQGGDHHLGKVSSGYHRNGTLDYLESSGTCFFTFTAETVCRLSFFLKTDNPEEVLKEMDGAINRDSQWLNGMVCHTSVIPHAGILFWFEEDLYPGNYEFQLYMTEGCQWFYQPAYEYTIDFYHADGGRMLYDDELKSTESGYIRQLSLDKQTQLDVTILMESGGAAFTPLFKLHDNIRGLRTGRDELVETERINAHCYRLTLPAGLCGKLDLLLCGMGNDGNLVPFTYALACSSGCGLDLQIRPQAKGAFIRTRTYTNAAGTGNMESICYYDGLGFPAQFNRAGASPLRKDLITLVEYDSQGNDSCRWLTVPLAANGNRLTGQSLRNNATFYHDDCAYELSFYESALQPRLLKHYEPGYDWHQSRTNRFTGYDYLTNDQATNQCARYRLNGSGMPVADGTYPSGSLFVTRTTDEDQHPVYEFKDSQERLLLQRAMDGAITYDTYYIYDLLGRLCYVLPPAANGGADATTLEKYAFQYKYDARSHCIEKKLPGSQPIKYVYDAANRLTFSQDGNQRTLTTGNWTYYKYDNLSRLTEQGICTNKVMTSGTTVHVKNYYDDYSFVGTTGFTNSRFTKDTSGKGKGTLTGNITTVLGSNTKLYTAYYYDIKGRVVKTVQSNLLGGYDVTETTYTFTNQPQTVTHTHTASGKNTRTEVYAYSYDHADRLVKVEHTLGSTKVTLATYTYDDLGRLQSKSLHGSDTNKQTYSYNIRSWLTGISGTKFTQSLYYNTGSGTAKYNGSISSMTWKAGDESTVRGYKFTYDGLDRMLNATYGETASISTNANRFSENVTGYDKNGNIKGLQRYGQTAASAYGLVDNLTFTLSGNQLSRVDDAVTASAYNNGFEFKDGVKQANEYAYDANGNLTKDLNKGITDIQYNCLNLPSKVTFSDGSTITYTYDADGTKLKTVHKIGGTTTTTDYCGNVVYENGVQKLLLTEEGYVTLSDGKYHYYLKDHQGNNRVVINQSGTVEETNHYYPFGGVFASSASVQPYKYNGKEFDTKKGLNWYDYGARHYDAALGRFHTNDRFAEKYPSLSTYQYGADNPIGNIDVNGDTIIVAPNPNGLLDKISMSLGYDTKYQRAVNADLQQLKKEDPVVKDMIERLEASEYTIEITGRTDKKRGNVTIPKGGKSIEDKQGSVVQYDPYDNFLPVSKKYRPARIGLVHELGHADDFSQGMGINIDRNKYEDKDPAEIIKKRQAEAHPIFMENRIRQKLNLKIRTIDDYIYGN